MEFGLLPQLLQLEVHADHVDLAGGRIDIFSSGSPPCWVSDLCCSTTELGISAPFVGDVDLRTHQGNSMEAMNVHPVQHHEW